MTKTVVVRYETRADAAAENQRLVEQVFDQLDRDRPDGLRYAAFRLAGGVGFVHVATTEHEDGALTGLTAFAEFQRGIGDRLVAPPVAAEATVVGSYRFLAAESLADERPAVAVAVALVEAFGKHDMATVARLLADDVVFESPRVRITGAEAVLEAMGEFARAVTGTTVIDAFGDDERAMVMYDVETGPFGTLRAVDHLVVRDGRITSDVLVFDTGALHR